MHEASTIPRRWGSEHHLLPPASSIALWYILSDVVGGLRAVGSVSQPTPSAAHSPLGAAQRQRANATRQWLACIQNSCCTHCSCVHVHRTMYSTPPPWLTRCSVAAAGASRAAHRCSKCTCCTQLHTCVHQSCVKAYTSDQSISNSYTRSNSQEQRGDLACLEWRQGLAAGSVRGALSTEACSCGGHLGRGECSERRVGRRSKRRRRCCVIACRHSCSLLI
mmetsp:Transcript_42761/g.128342  ORF Transcript_42761/g.128342 Transcript_42761/m.128342 type:complete len:221 (-) Transcript_42761:1343-2005(-)